MRAVSTRIVPLLVAVALVAAILAVYAPVLGHGFIEQYDDEKYVTENRFVQMGPTAPSLRWALTTMKASNWHPLTWLSHMLDCRLYGLRPAGHHATSVLLHAVNALLLFLLLHRMTRAAGRSAFVAALFALHPLHVESVAWIAERKDVLSTFLGLLAIGAYVLYAEDRSPMRYAVVLVAFALGLAAKPMLVTLPFVLLLLDYWPLGRLRREGGHRGQELSFAQLVVEKMPLLALAFASCVITVIAQRTGGALGSFARYPLPARLANALVAYGAYIGKTLWPHDLAVFYPHPGGGLAGWRIGGALLLLVGATALAIRWRRQAPYVPVGWLWYLCTLVPVIGLVQVGQQSMADRYTYVPLIGLFLIVAWGVPEALGRVRIAAPRALAIASLAVLTALAVAARLQVTHWRDSVTLFEHALRVTGDNSVAHTDLGIALFERGRLQEAIEHYNEALRIDPNSAVAHLDLGLALYSLGKDREAVEQYEDALRIRPSFPEAHRNLGVVFYRQNRIDEALDRFSEALRIHPDYVDALYSKGTALAAKGRLEEAAEALTRTIEVKPDHALAHSNLAWVFYLEGDYEGAWREVGRSRSLGHEPPASLLRKLSDKLPAPQ